MLSFTTFSKSEKRIECKLDFSSNFRLLYSIYWRESRVTLILLNGMQFAEFYQDTLSILYDFLILFWGCQKCQFDQYLKPIIKLPYVFLINIIMLLRKNLPNDFLKLLGKLWFMLWRFRKPRTDKVKLIAIFGVNFAALDR